jgi:MFS family permease
MLMMVLNMTMFSVSLPVLRDTFGITVDSTAWLETAYALPLVILMPLYGQLGDGLGKRRLFMLGIGIFLAGTAIIPLSANLWLVMVGRMIQGMGAASVNPLCIAIISERFPPQTRGKALGTWNSAGPIAGLAGPLLGGFFVDLFGWRLPFAVVFVLGTMALLAVKVGVPAGARSFIQGDYVRRFDWTGVLLLTVAVTAFIFFTSSRPITGVSALQDWRLLLVAVSFLVAFVLWERQNPNPFVPLVMFRNRSFVLASVISGLRMWTLISAGFLNTLYLTDVWHLSVTAVGACKMLLAAGLLLTIIYGGSLADRWGSRRPSIAGLLVQTVTLLGLALLPDTVPLLLVLVLFTLHGTGAGLSLAGLHRSALGKILPERLGLASGLYGMIRFGGMVTGVALVGVLLEAGLNYYADPLPAYQVSYAFTAMAALTGALVVWFLREEPSPEQVSS